MMTAETEDLVLHLLQEIRKEQAEQHPVLLELASLTRRMGEGVSGFNAGIRGLEQRLDARLTGFRDDLALRLKSELLGRLTRFEASIDEKLERLTERVSALEA